MSGSIYLKTLQDSDLKSRLMKLAAEHLRTNGDTGIRIGSVHRECDGSTEAAEIFWVHFESDAGANILAVTLFANDTHMIEEL